MIYIIIKYSQELIEANILLLDEPDNDASSVAEGFLRNSLALSDTISSQVMQLLILHLKEEILTKNQFNLLDKIMSKFMTNCLQCRLMKSMDIAMFTNRSKSMSNDSLVRSRAVGLESLQLGDIVEIMLSTEWFLGTVVKVNSMTGELHIEHSNPGNPSSLQVSIIHRNSDRLRSATLTTASSNTFISAHRPDPNIMQNPVVVNDHIAMPAGLATMDEESSHDLRDPSFDIKFDHTANNDFGERIMIDISLLLYGRYPYHEVDANRRVAGVDGCELLLIHNSGRNIDEAPHCEHGHICQVKPISLNNIGFMCVYCTKLYSLGPNQPTFGRQFPELAHLVQSRYAQATHRWTCEDCNYDLCFNCFPCKSLDHTFDVADAMLGLSSAAYKTSSPYHNMNRYSGKKDDMKLKHHGTGQRQTICLIGRLESSYCVVREAPSHDAREVSRVSVNSVIDVIDTSNCDYYQLIGSKGYVRKVLGVGWYWRTLPRDRYMVYNTEKEESESIADGIPPIEDSRLSKDDDEHPQEKASSNHINVGTGNPPVGSTANVEPTSSELSVSFLFAMVLQNIISIDKARKDLLHISCSKVVETGTVDDRLLRIHTMQSELRIELSSILRHALLLVTQV